MPQRWGLTIELSSRRGLSRIDAADQTRFFLSIDRLTPRRHRRTALEAGEGKQDARDGRIDIEVADVYKDEASVTVHTATYHEYLHLVRTADGWRIANALWQFS